MSQMLEEYSIRLLGLEDIEDSKCQEHTREEWGLRLAANSPKVGGISVGMGVVTI